MNKRILMPAVFLLIALATMGMDGLGLDGSGPQRIPQPDQDFRVTVVDQADVRTSLTMFSINGYTYFMGQQGKGQYAIPFSSIKQADFRLVGNELQVLVQLTDGKSLTVTADQDIMCYGKTEYGNFQIPLGDVRLITVEGPAALAASQN